MSGPAAEIRRDESVRRSYLGYEERHDMEGVLHQVLSGIATRRHLCLAWRWRW